MTERCDAASASNPLQLLHQVADKALTDTGAAEVLAQIDSIGVVSLTTDFPNTRIQTGHFPNLPKSLGNALGADNAVNHIYTSVGGNSPQLLVNTFAERIANGDADVALLAGCENLDTLIERLKQGLSLDDWNDDPGDKPELLGQNRLGNSDLEERYELTRPTHIYPLFEIALRAHYNRDPEQHQEQLGRLFASFNAVAADNPLSWFPQRRSSEEITKVSDSNRWVGYPYTKYLNSVIKVNMAAGVVMCSVEKAEQLGIPADRWVFLHGCSDLYDKWYVSEREQLHRSPAIKSMGEQAFQMAGIGVDQLTHMDIYSCFPSAVQVACDEIGISHQDLRGLTLTGGLPYFGGPGSNYTMHGIAQAVMHCRGNPDRWILVTGNGWYLTKHSCGIYSNTPYQGEWQRPASLQAEIDNQPSVEIQENAGVASARIESYSLIYGRKGPETGMALLRLEGGQRTFAKIAEPGGANWQRLMQQDGVGMTASIAHKDGLNYLSLK